MASTYFVNASGSNTAPFDTPAKGASNFQSLATGVVLADGVSIEVVNDGEIQDNIPASTTLTLKGTIRSYGTDGTDRLTSKPTWRLRYTDAASHVVLSASAKINALKMYCDSMTVSKQMIAWSDNAEVTQCDIWTSVAITAVFQGLVDNNITGIKIKNNTIRTIGSGSIGTVMSHTLMGALAGEFVCNSVYGNITRFYSSFSALDSVIANNIVRAIAGANFFTSSSFGFTYLDYNCAFGFTSPYPNKPAGPNSLLVDPKFVDPSNGDLTLDPITSPCINAGVGNGTQSAVPTTDIIGRDRPFIYPDHAVVNDGTDIGAYEIQGITLNILNSTFDNSESTITADFVVGTNTDNQFNWPTPTNYPFTLAAGASFGYGQNLDWLSANPGKIAPFDGVTTPPNPGLNYPTYPNYPTGLFGYDRATYERDN